MNRNIIAVILIVLSIGIYFTVTEKMIKEVGAVQSVNDKYIAAIDSAKKLISIRDKVLNDYNSLTQEDRVRLEKMIPQSVDNIRLIIDLNSVAVKHGFSLKGIKATASGQNKKADTRVPSVPAVQNASIGGGARDPFAATSNIPISVLDTVTINFGLSAPYQQFISFLQDIEANLRIMDVTRITATANDTGIYDWNVEIKTYWLRSQ